MGDIHSTEADRIAAAYLDDRAVSTYGIEPSDREIVDDLERRHIIGAIVADELRSRTASSPNGRHRDRPCDASDANECAMMRERSVAGTAEPIPECPTHAPWSDEDDAELERAMADARHAIGARWSDARHDVPFERRARIDREPLWWIATAGEREDALRIRAGRSGLVPLIGDPTGAARVHELVSVWTAYLDWSRGTDQAHAALIASHQDFEERTAIRAGTAGTWPIVQAALEPTAPRSFPGPLAVAYGVDASR